MTCAKYIPFVIQLVWGICAFSQTRTYLPGNPFDIYHQKSVTPYYMLLGYEDMVDDVWNIEEGDKKYYSGKEIIDSGEIRPVALDITMHKPFEDIVPDSAFQIKNLHFIHIHKAEWELPNNHKWTDFKNLQGISLSDIHIQFGDSTTKIPSSIFDIERLKYLEVISSGIEIDGSIKNADSLKYLAMVETYPPSFPKEIFQLKSLEHLMLSNFAGRLPNEIYECKKLKTLILDRVSSANLHPHLNKFPSLEYLAITDHLMDTLFSGIVDLSNLETLLLHGVRLSVFPSEIRSLKNLKRLRVVGPCRGFPIWLPELKELAHIELRIGEPGFNRWMSMLSEIASLENLSLSFMYQDNIEFVDTIITYIIPDSFSNLQNLRSLGLQLTDSRRSKKDQIKRFLVIPDSFSKLDNLTYFNASLRIRDLDSLGNLCKIKSLKGIRLLGYYNQSGSGELSVNEIKQYVKQNRPDIKLIVESW